MNELKIVELQLGRNISNFLKTAKYCPFGYPAVVTVDPYLNKIPAPTIYWLSCPHLNYETAALEAESDLISKLGKKLKKDSQFKKIMDINHQDYAQKRKKLLSEKSLKEAKKVSEDLYNTLLNSGVGGIKEKKGIKCLHTHLADYLVNKNNPAGEIIFSKLKWPQSCNICKERIDNVESSCS